VSPTSDEDGSALANRSEAGSTASFNDNAASVGCHTLASASISSSRSRKPYKLARSRNRAKNHHDDNSDSDLDGTTDKDYRVHEPTRNLLKEVAGMSPAQRQALFQALMAYDLNFCTPPQKFSLQAEPAEEPSPRPMQDDAPLPTTAATTAPTTAATTAPTTAATTTGTTTGRTAGAPAPDPKPEPAPVQVDDSDSSSSDTPPPPPPKRVHAVPHKARPASPKPPPPPPAGCAGGGVWQVGAPAVKPPPPAVLPPAVLPPLPPLRPLMTTAAPVPSTAVPYTGMLDYLGQPRAPGCDYFGRPVPPKAPPPATMPKPPPPSLTVPFNLKGRQDAINQMLRGLEVCPLCNRLCSPEHLLSGRHALKVKEHADLDMLVGPPGSGRLRELHCTASKPWVVSDRRAFTRAAASYHWGIDLKSMGARALNRLRVTGGFKCGKHFFPWSPQWQAEVILVSYSGQGKYRDSDFGVPLAVLPAGGSSRGGMRPGSSNDPPPAYELAQEEAVEHVGWWPTVHIWIPGPFNSADHPPVLIPTCSGMVCAVICIYQTLWDEPGAWWIRICNYRTRL
jgi:hypothetical protein